MNATRSPDTSGASGSRQRHMDSVGIAEVQKSGKLVGLELDEERKDAPTPLQGSGFGKSSQDVHGIANRMRQTGGHTVVDLPYVAVIGNQSAGKSSLIQSITEVPVPSSDGTTTRAPTEVRMKRTEASVPWSAQISIRWEYDSAGRKLFDVKEVKFGPRLERKEDVELMLLRAQAAVLNPSEDVSKFAQMDAEELASRASLSRTIAFSKNVICIDLAGPGLVDLSFIDLPGIIQNVENDPKGELVQLVQELVNTYIKGNCLILETISMSDEIENQKAGYLAKQADPTGSRTIGVLTKADTIPQGSRGKQQRWRDVLEGRLHPTKHGYFCTRLPDDREREGGITPEAARKAEDDFFSTNAPWSTSTHRDRCGTQALVKYLSELLTQRIRDSLPKIRREVDAQLQDCKTQLDALPQAIASEPCSFVNTQLMDFCDAIKAHVRGSPTSAALVQTNKQTYRVLKTDIRRTSPAFVPFEPTEAFCRDVVQFTEKNINAWSERLGRLMYLPDIRERIASHVTRELPNNVPYAAKVSLILDFQLTWEQSMFKCFDAVQKSVDEFLTRHIDQQFQRYGNLKAIVSSVVLEQVKLHAETTARQLRIIRTYEANFQDTLNVEELAEERSGWLALYKDARANRERIRASGETKVPPPFYTTPPKSASGSPPLFGQTPQPGAQAFTFGFGGSVPSGSAGTAPAPNGAAPSPRATPQPSTSTKPPGSSPPGASVPPSPQPQPNASSGTATTPLTGTARTKAEEDVSALLQKLGIKLKPEDLAKFTPADENQEVLELMAEVRAYFDIASKRVVDLVMFAIDQHFLYEFSAALHRVLYEKLGLHEPNARERCMGYLVEDPSVAAKRIELLALQAQLEGIRNDLVSFGW